VDNEEVREKQKTVNQCTLNKETKIMLNLDKKSIQA